MPTIEIASLNSPGLGLQQDDFDVAISEETKLKSHRGLFYDFLVAQKGTIIHLGNSDMKANPDEGYFAGELINWDSGDHKINPDIRFKFKPEYQDDINRILKLAMENSPDNCIFFLTDYQFCKKAASFKTQRSIINFWEQHGRSGLEWNTLYKITGVE